MAAFGMKKQRSAIMQKENKSIDNETYWKFAIMDFLIFGYANILGLFMYLTYIDVMKIYFD